MRVLVAEDSQVMRELMVHVLESDSAMQVVGAVASGEEALAAVQRLKPDVVAMDYQMPGMDGMAATRRIMETCPVPVVIVSASVSGDEGRRAFQVLDAGALALVEKPPALDHPRHPSIARELVQTLRLMSEVKVVKRWPRRVRAAQPVPPAIASASAPLRFVAIGASTGGPIVLKTILAGLPRPFPVPILIVQHIAAGFTEGLAGWLSQASAMPVRIAAHGERPLPGHAYLAPDDRHLRLGHDGRLALSAGPPENGHRPSVSHLFRSVAALGRGVVGVILTGMGKDGAEELKVMKESGAVSIAQDKESSTVYGMPGHTVAIGGATHVLPPAAIAAALARLAAADSGNGTAS